MAKRKKTKGGFPENDPPPNRTTQPGGGRKPPPPRWGLIALFLLITVGGTYFMLAMRPKPQAEEYTFEVLKTYPHDATAFTQGLIYHDGYLWESTGRYGQSTMRKTDLKTGEVISKFPLDDDLFGEGMTWLNGKFYQLTWKRGIAFVYEFVDDEFKVVKQFKYTGEGWGLTTDGTDLIFSSGSPELKFLDPETFEEKRSVWVRLPSGRQVGQLNELEFFQGKVYANKYQSDFIYEIDPETGDVTKQLNLKGLWPDHPPDGVLNGIAVNPKSNRLLVTGKLCPHVFEIAPKLVESQK